MDGSFSSDAARDATADATPAATGDDPTPYAHLSSDELEARAGDPPRARQP